MYRDHKMEYIYSLLRCQRNLILQFSRYKTLYKTWKNKYEFYLHCWDHVCKANEWRSFDCFHHKFRVSTKTMVCDYCITKCKKCSTRDRLLMIIWLIFLGIQNICMNWNLAWLNQRKVKQERPFQGFFIRFICSACTLKINMY